jgi:2-oxoisovalerate dehydrogenase E1 component alpha subunit
MPEMNNEDQSDHGSGSARRPVRLAAPAVIRSGREAISAELALTIFRQMLRTRALEERSIKMSKSGEAYFWIGGPGEEAFNVCLGLQIHKGFGPAFDYTHLHYRNAGVMLAMGMPMIDHVRQLAMRRTDPHSRGRNFVGHYAVKAWNVVPVSSVIEVQFSMAPGTALMQKRHGEKNPAEAEARPVAQRPFEVVHQTPNIIPLDIGDRLDRLMDRLQVRPDIADPGWILHPAL